MLMTVQDYAMICLVDNYEVICFHHDANFKISSVENPRLPCSGMRKLITADSQALVVVVSDIALPI